MKKYKNKNIYIKLPDGRFALLEKYLYGLKQSGLEWNELQSKVILYQNGYNLKLIHVCSMDNSKMDII